MLKFSVKLANTVRKANAVRKANILSALSLALLINVSGLCQLAADAAWYDNENTFLDRGKQSYNTGGFDQAISQFSECIKLNPARADAFYWRAMAYQGIKQQDKALRDLDEAIRLAPDCASCYLSRGLIYSNQGKLSEALEQFNEALRYDSNLAEAEINKKFCLKEIEKQRIAKENPQPAAVHSTVLAVATKPLNGSGTASVRPVAKANPTNTGTAGNTTKIAGAPAATNDPQWAKLEKELELKTQREKADADRALALRLKQEAEVKRLDMKQKEIDERHEREKIAKEERDARHIAMATKNSGTSKISAGKSESQEEEQSALELVNRPVRDKWALIVGISNFADSTLNLKYPSKDAKDFHDFLIKEANFKPDHVKLLVDKDATRANILTELGDKWLPRVANPDDLVLIYISSHGSASDMDVAGTNYLLAYDSQVDNLYASGLPMQDLTRIIKGRVHSDRVVLVLDACHSGAAEAGSKGLHRTGNVDVDAVVAGTGQLVISSSQPSQVSWESKNYQNSVFTKCLIDSLRKDGANTTLGEAFSNLRDRVQEEVLRERGVMQTPVLKSRWKGSDLRLSSPATSPRPGLVETP